MSDDARKRKRVAFAAGAAAESQAGKRPRTSEVVADNSDMSEGAVQARSLKQLQRLQRQFAESGADEVRSNVVGHIETAGYDEVDDDANDDGQELEEAAGAGTTVGSKPKRPASAGGNGDEGEDGGSRVEVLQRVAGEHRGPMEEDFNDAGQAFEPFHLGRERDEGYFDTSGNYVWKKKTADDHDPWLDGLDEMDPRQRSRMQSDAAKQAGFVASSGQKGELEEDADAVSEGASDDEEDASIPPAKKAEYLKTIASILEDGETVTAALRRLGRVKPGQPKATKLDTVSRGAFNALTDAADALLRSGMMDVYNTVRKELVWELAEARVEAGLPRDVELRATTATTAGAAGAGTTGNDTGANAGEAGSTDASGGVVATAFALPPTLTDQHWLYRWDSREGAPEFGPFSSGEMAAWKAAGFFSAAPAFVKEAPVTSGEGSSAAAATVASGGGMADEDDDDDIFSGAGRYTAPATASWRPITEVTF